MKRIFKWIGIVTGVLVGIIVIALIAAIVVSSSRLNRTYEVTAEFALEIPDDQERIAAGEHTYLLMCESCHGENLAGKEFSDDFAFGRIYTANLTSGAGGIISIYGDEDIARAVWYGVKQDGSPTVGMPYEWNQAIHITDMENVIAYLRSAQPVDTDHPEPSYGPIMRVMHVTGLFPVVAVEHIDLSAPPPSPVSSEDTIAFGAYLVEYCKACHMQDLTGNTMFGSPNITPHESAIGTWTEEEFKRAITEGIRPDGTTLDPEQMPWETFTRYSEEELHAIYTYLQTVEPVAVD